MYDERLDYITGELRRARNKRYESYVINRIWGLVCDLPLRPRTQMYARVEGGGRRFVDLCIPEVGIAVEVDEAQHASQAEADRERERQITASDILDGLYEGELEFCRVPVYDRTFDQVEARIEAVAKRIRKKAEGIPAEGTWLFLDHERWCEQAKEIAAGDPVRFPTMVDALNCVLGCDYKPGRGLQRGFFTPAPFRGTDRDGWKVWFPHLTAGDEAANSKGYRNYIDAETGEITETWPPMTAYFCDRPEDAPTRVVFVRERDRLTGRTSYRFAGIYRTTRIEQGDDPRTATHVRVSDRMPIARG